MELIKTLNYEILRRTKNLRYEVREIAPSRFEELKHQGLVVWSGASESTIYGDEQVNFALRAWHDMSHIETGLGFSPEHEIELGRLNALKFDGILADIIYCEVAGQAEHYLRTGDFVVNQIEFTKQYLRELKHENLNLKL